ncbi:hypothetical protein GM418_18410 [Maribellus comscasis]|uniref:Uncharacterized protein n=1 Tax=Maribellus comscasis TaxID=2681766 RepID=A0A6I6JSY8_9BACT|nr:hypothetical protein [Maribellus comscasis]QGY45571.1 hypothetical protein GM418_18410 [Maribellus comscasis]
MPRKLNTFSNGGFIEFNSGSFDDWCVYLTKPGGERFAPTDERYFRRLKKLGKKYGNQKIYDDFVLIFDKTTAQLDKHIFKQITKISQYYNHGSDRLEIEIWFNVLYAGMVAEENKEKAVLKKRIKRLGMHHLLIDNLEPEVAANFSKGVKWQALDRLMRAKGF